ncbi:serine/threonine-protein kinase [Streptomyces sp. P9(2023)]|uniref:serine/threonine-protein kinase n=1 Tax=Streptomyces sp. P9(2023) TaxID=3064394 RepID=UPI0028F4535C|nr:serine/threonine-protein kinase [Streptomyces sp. P9(2023)]MDT9687300.1 serine/threonine-protein kinase [Streptomyces sp. P9(2023)]
MESRAQPLGGDDPEQVGPYRISGLLGRGGMGSVYLARSRGGRALAVKVIRPELAGDAEFRRRFAREVRLARSAGGVFTAGVVDADPDGEPPWLATVYVPGPSLDGAVREHGAWPEDSVLALAAGLAEALEAIHAGGVIHRDPKPSNILLASDGPRVIDFGISASAEATSALTRSGVVLGSVGFMAPEQLTGAEVTGAVDVFALGSVLAFAATGHGPFGGTSAGGGDGASPARVMYRVAHEEPELTRCRPGSGRSSPAAWPRRRATVLRYGSFWTGSHRSPSPVTPGCRPPLRTPCRARRRSRRRCRWHRPPRHPPFSTRHRPGLPPAPGRTSPPGCVGDVQDAVPAPGAATVPATPAVHLAKQPPVRKGARGGPIAAAVAAAVLATGGLTWYLAGNPGGSGANSATDTPTPSVSASVSASTTASSQPAPAPPKPTTTSPTADDDVPNPVVGNWWGSYNCSQGVTRLSLRITASPTGALEAVFSFSAHPDNPGVPSGSFRMVGAYEEAGRRMVLRADRWIDQPDGYLMVDLEARVPAGEQPLAMDGDVVNDDTDCTTFAVVRRAL